MAWVFPMPEVGEGVVEAEVAHWKVGVGDLVKADQPLCEITTDKASVEISSPRSGRVTKLFAHAGEIVKVHAPLAEIELEGDVPAPVTHVPQASVPASVTPAPAPTPAAAPLPPPVLPGTPAKAAPAVRRRAHELDVNLDAVPGTGPGGRVTHADLDHALATVRTPAPAPVAAAPLPKAPVALPQVRPSGSEERIKIVGVRRKIAERMVAAKQSAPHFTYVEEIDCTRLVDMRDRLKGRAAQRGVKLSFLPFFAKACSLAFRDFPNVNAWMDNEASELIVKADHHIGFACDTPTGLMVPVVRNVEQKSILRIAAEMNDLFDRTRAGKATRDELGGSTFTITGVGNIGGVLATPILNVPEVGILGINQIKKRPVVDENDQIVVRQMTYLSPSFDHRIIDGAVGARFTAKLKEILENPECLVLELA